MDLSDFKALVVEDNEFIRYTVKKYLKGFGFNEVFEATDGFEGINALNENYPDIVVCDINMMPIDGFEFLKHVRRLEGNLKELPVIFLTSNADEEFVKKAMALNVDAYLLKPVTPNNLKSRVSKLMKQKYGL